MRDLTEYYRKLTETHGKAIADATYELHTLYDEKIYKWLASLWDKENGGFYYSISARDNEGFWPDIESTAQAFNSLSSTGIVTEKTPVPESMQKKAIAFMQAKQDPEDGYFYHKQWGKDITTSRRARDLGNAVSVIKRFGSSPLYPTATERISSLSDSERNSGESMIPDHLRSKEAFLEYLNGLDINGLEKPGNSYPMGHRIGAQTAEIMAAGLTDVVVDFLNSKQRPNGFWEDILDHGSSSGPMKISCAYVSLGRPFPNIMKAFDSALEVLLADLPIGSITSIFNPPFSLLNFLEIMERTGDTDNLAKAKAHLLERGADIIRVTTERLLPYKKPDGSFSYCPNCSSHWSQGKPVCIKDSFESDVNANSLGNGSRVRTLKILGIEPPHVFDENDAKIFYELCGEN